MNKIKRLICAMLALALCMLTSLPVFADSVDLTQKSSITIDLRDPQTGAALSGGWLYLYRVADVSLSGGSYVFNPVERFDKGFDFSNIKSRDLVRTVYNYIRDNSYKCDLYAAVAGGSVRFSDLTPGLYIVIQAGQINGYYPMNPFMVSMILTQPPKWSLTSFQLLLRRPIPTPTQSRMTRTISRSFRRRIRLKPAKSAISFRIITSFSLQKP